MWSQAAGDESGKVAVSTFCLGNGRPLKGNERKHLVIVFGAWGLISFNLQSNSEAYCPFL